MKINKPYRSEDTRTSNKNVKIFAGANDNRNDLKNISVDFYDIDYAIKWHIENVIRPTITEDNSVITVPILFANGEKWAAVQKHGYLRDNQGKLLTPLIMIRRNNAEARQDITRLKTLEEAENRMLFEKKYTKQNRYDRFSLSNKTPEKEYWSMSLPRYLQVNYDILCWTNNSVQLNDIIEQLVWYDGKAFGDSHKFTTFIDMPAFDSVNSIGEDRIVRATLTARTKGHLVGVKGINTAPLYKLNPITKVNISTESEILSVGAGETVSSPVVQVSGGTSGINSATSLSILLSTYLNTNKQLAGAVISTTEVSFPSGFKTAPSMLPATSVANFVFFINGQYVEPSAIVSFVDNGNNTCTLTVSVTELGFSLQTSDEIIAIGKFN